MLKSMDYTLNGLIIWYVNYISIKLILNIKIKTERIHDAKSDKDRRKVVAWVAREVHTETDSGLGLPTEQHLGQPEKVGHPDRRSHGMTREVWLRPDATWFDLTTRLFPWGAHLMPGL